MLCLANRLLVAAIAASTAAIDSARAAPVETTTINDLAGDPIEQRFVGGEASVVRTPRGAACVLSATLDIRDSIYFDPATRTRVPFDEVRRSFATSAQMIVTADGAQSMRVQFKYSLHPDHPATLHLADRSVSLEAWREPSGDSVLIDDEAILRDIRAAMEAGEGPRLVGRSRDTGRIVEDRLPQADFAPLDFCAASLPALAPAGAPEPTNALSVEFVANRDDAFRITPQDARICARTDDGAELYRGALQRTTGFFSQTSKVFVSFDPDGAVDSVYIPGIFEARARDDGFAADLSIAANANDPLAPAGTTGCLGAAPVEICAYPAEGDEPGVTRFGPCFGALAMGELFDDPTLLSGDFSDPSSRRGMILSTPLARAGSAAAPFAFPSMGFGGGFGGGRSSRSADAPPPSFDPWLGDDPDEGARKDDGGGLMAVIPLPPSFLLYAAALGIGLITWRRARPVV